MAVARASAARAGGRWPLIVFAALLTGVNLAIYAQVLGHGFSLYDDAIHVTHNPMVRGGVTWEGVRWAFTTTYESNWHPLTWLSFMLDSSLGGMSPRTFHATNLLLHCANSILLFLVLSSMTGALGRSVLVALVFAAHPLHVESVAWISERKDVLSTLFWILAMFAWARYAASPGPRRYLVVAALLAAGLMAKPMLVSLPIVLLLLDVWPLGRLESLTRRNMVRLVAEKVPLLSLSALSAVITIFAQRGGSSLGSLEHHSLGLRVANALVAYATYLRKTLWPTGLAVFYPHPGATLPLWRTLIALLILVAVTAAALRLLRARPYVAVGWLWYLVTLVPVVGLVQVGLQGMADRYTYVPMIGLLIALVWGGADLLEYFGSRARPLAKDAPRREPKKKGRASAGGSRPIPSTAWGIGLSFLIVAALTVLAFRQARLWRDDESLFRSAIAATGPNGVAHKVLGSILLRRGRIAEAAAELEAAVRIAPSYAAAHTDLAGVRIVQGDMAGAEHACQQALRLWPGNARALTNLGLVRIRQGRIAEAEELLLAAVRASPAHAPARVNLGLALMQEGRFEEAAAEIRIGLRSEPDNVDGRINLGVALARQGRLEDAAAEFAEALRIDPNDSRARKNLETVRTMSQEAR